MTLALTLFFYWLSLVLLNKYFTDPGLKTKWITLILLTPFVIYPFEYAPIWWLRGLTGDLSITSLLLLGSAIYLQLFSQDLITKQDKKALWLGIVITGVLFYPLALGLGDFDPYALGFHDGYFVALVLMLSLAAFMLRYFAVASILTLDVIFWNAQLLQSVNLWDYLIDPFVFFYCLGGVIKWKR